MPNVPCSNRRRSSTLLAIRSDSNYFAARRLSIELHSRKLCNLPLFCSLAPFSTLQTPKMNLFRNARKSSLLIKMAHRNQGMASLLYNSSRHFSTEGGQPRQEISFDSFLQPPSTGLVYGRLSGIRKHTTKTDILNLLEGSNLSSEDVKVDYNRSYFPMAMLVQFPTPESYDAGVRSIIRKGRLYKLERTDRNQWDEVKPYDGKAILLQGIPRNALSEDIERFLSGCEHDSSSIALFTRQAFPDPIRIARVHFPSRALAMHAFITKNRGFCLNNQILVEVLQ